MCFSCFIYFVGSWLVDSVVCEIADGIGYFYLQLMSGGGNIKRWVCVIIFCLFVLVSNCCPWDLSFVIWIIKTNQAWCVGFPFLLLIFKPMRNFYANLKQVISNVMLFFTWNQVICRHKLLFLRNKPFNKPNSGIHYRQKEIIFL